MSKALNNKVKLNDVVSVKDFGADPTGVADSSAAFTAAIATAGANGLKINASGKFLFLSSVTGSAANITIEGDGETEFTAGVGVTMFATTGARLKFNGVAFTSTTTSLTSVTGAVNLTNADDLAFFNCRFGRVLVYMRSDTTATRKRLRVLGCTFEADYTNTMAADTVNVFDVRGVQNIVFANNIVECTNYYRLLKISTAVIGGNAFQPAYPSGRIAITGNTMLTGGNAVQQVIDLSFGSQQVVISGNQIETTGTTVPYVIHAKSARSGSTGSTPDRVTISGNTISCGAGTQCAIYMESNWGITGWVSNTRLAVNGNTVTAVDGIASLIQIKGFNFVSVDSNVLDQGAAAYGRSIAVTNCQDAQIVGNVSGFGSIEINGAGSTQDGDNYTLSPQSLLISDNTIEDFNSQGGVNIFNCSALEDLTIHDNHIRNQTDYAAIQGAIYVSSTTAAKANVHDNIADCANTSKNYIIKSTVTFTEKRERGNNWNTVSVTWDPASVNNGAATNLTSITLNGAELGDWIQVSSSADTQGLMATGYLSAAQTAVILLYNNTGGAVNLGSSTWRVSYGRG